jgi:hypothetical protein
MTLRNIRCRLSSVGIEWLKPRTKHVLREGTIVREWTSSYGVKWDGNISIGCYAKKFIEPIGEHIDMDMRGLLKG